MVPTRARPLPLPYLTFKHELPTMYLQNINVTHSAMPSTVYTLHVHAMTSTVRTLHVQAMPSTVRTLHVHAMPSTVRTLHVQTCLLNMFETNLTWLPLPADKTLISDDVQHSVFSHLKVCIILYNIEHIHMFQWGFSRCTAWPSKWRHYCSTLRTCSMHDAD